MTRYLVGCLLVFCALSAFAGDEECFKRSDETQQQYRARIVKIAAATVNFKPTKSYTVENFFKIIEDAEKSERFNLAIHEYAKTVNRYPKTVTLEMARAAWLELFLDVFLVVQPDAQVDIEAFDVFETGLKQDLKADYHEPALAEFERKELAARFKSLSLPYRKVLMSFVKDKRHTQAQQGLLMDMLDLEQDYEFRASVIVGLARMPTVSVEEFRKILGLYQIDSGLSFGRLFIAAAIKIYVSRPDLPKTHLKEYKKFIGRIRHAGYFYLYADLIEFNRTLKAIQKGPISKACTSIMMGYDFMALLARPMR